MKPVRLLFVCLGNICRSPSAEAVMNHLIQSQGLQTQFICDSAATSGHHEGEGADPRSIAHGKKRGYNLTSIARPLRPEDFETFDHILVMDDNNLADALEICPRPELRSKLRKLTDYSRQGHSKVPDPYYGGTDGFERVLDILEDSCENLLKSLQGPSPQR